MTANVIRDLRVALEQKPTVMLIDDAHTWIAARIGGAKFDEIIALARVQSSDITWVFAIDASVWPLLGRTRDTGPVFDSTHLPRALSPIDLTSTFVS